MAEERQPSFWKKLAWHIKLYLLKVHFNLKEINYFPICARSILTVYSRRVFSLFERETTKGLHVCRKLNAIYQN
jgi:hypothetical protein